MSFLSGLAGLMEIGDASIKIATAISHVIGRRRGDYKVLRRLFPIFGEPHLISTGQYLSKLNFELDPEDAAAARALVNTFFGVFAKARQRKNITVIEHLFERSANSHLIAVGGPLSNRANTDLAHLPPFHQRKRPQVPIYLFVNPNATPKVRRRFDGVVRDRGRYHLVDQITNSIFEPKTNAEGWLMRDYLLCSYMPIEESFGHKIDRLSLMGLYGPGVRATELLVANKNSVLDEIEKSRGRHRYFQSLLAVEGISHKGPFSTARTIRHLLTYPLTGSIIEPYVRLNSLA